MGASPPGPVCRVVRLRVSPFKGAGCPATHLRVARRGARPTASRSPTPRSKELQRQQEGRVAGAPQAARPGRRGLGGPPELHSRKRVVPLLPQSRSARRPELQHPRRRLQEQRERHHCLGGAIPTLCRPGWQDAAGVPGAEAQPAAGRECLLTRVLLVSSRPEPQHPAAAARCLMPPASFGGGGEDRRSGGGSAFRPRFYLRVGPSHAGCVVPACAPRADRAGAGRGAGPGYLVAGAQGFRALPLAAPRAPGAREAAEEENGGCLRGICPAGKRTAPRPGRLPPLELRDSQF